MRYDSKGRFVKQSTEERFWPKVSKTDSCWVWTGATNQFGYGTLRVSGSKKRERAHRISWRLHYGDIPDGLQVLHHCDNPRCVRPDHLHLGVDADNHADRKAHGIVLNGERNPASKLTAEAVETIRHEYKPRPCGCPKGGRYRGKYQGSAQELAERFGVSHAQIQRIVKGSRWT